MSTAQQLQALAKLLQQKYPNAQQDINQPRIPTGNIPNTPWTGTTLGTPPATVWGTPPTTVNPPGPTGDVGGTGKGSNPDPGTYGMMTTAERNALSNLAGVFGLGGLVSPGLGVIGYGLRGALAADALGLAKGRGVTGLTDADIADISAYSGNIAGKNAAEARAAAEAARANEIGPGIMGTEGGPKSPGETPDSPTDVESGRNNPGPAGEAPTGSPTDTESGANGPSGGFGGGQADGEGSAAGDSGGHGSTGDGSMNAQGGVRKARTATRTTFGEAGPETAIFIPEIMKRAGIQGREAEVIRTLKNMIRILEGNKGGPDSESPKAERKEHANGGRRQ